MADYYKGKVKIILWVDTDNSNGDWQDPEEEMYEMVEKNLEEHCLEAIEKKNFDIVIKEIEFIESTNYEG